MKIKMKETLINSLYKQRYVSLENVYVQKDTSGNSRVGIKSERCETDQIPL